MNRTLRSSQGLLKCTDRTWRRHYSSAPRSTTAMAPRRLFVYGLCGGLLGYGGWQWYQQQQQPRKGQLDSNRYVPLDLVDKQTVSPDTVRLRLEVNPMAGEEYPVPSCLYIKDDTIQVMRPYTPINANPYKDGYIDLVVKRYPNGSISRTLSGYPLNEPVFVRGPMLEEYQYKSNTLDEIGMIAGGTGISPMYQLIKRILEDDQDTQSKHIWLIYANKKERDILLKQELDKLAEEHKGRFKVMYVLEQPSSEDWQGQRGRVTANMVDSMLLKKKDAGETDQSHRRLVFVCGPDGMLNSVCGQRARDYTQGTLTGMLAQLGLTSEEVWKFQ